MAESKPGRKFNLLSTAGYVIVTAVGLPMLFSAFQQDLAYKWMMAGLLVTIVLLILLQDRQIWPESPTLSFVYLAVLTVLISILALLDPNTGSGIILFFMLSAQATSLYTWRKGLVWLGVFTVVTAVILVIAYGSPEGLVILPIYAAGYAFFATFANQTREAIAAENESQRLYRELQKAHQQLQDYASQIETLTIVNERSRMAREMHDTLGHRLTVSAVQLEAAQRLVRSDPDKTESMIGNVREQIGEALRELRRTVATLRAPVEEDLALRSSLQRLVVQFEEGAGMEVTLNVADELPPLQPQQRKAVYRAAQESLTNVQRHANASHVWIDLQQANGSLELAVRDDGVGAPAQTGTGGFGVRGLQERAAQLGGAFQLSSHPEGGAQALFIIPVDQDETVESEPKDQQA